MGGGYAEHGLERILEAAQGFKPAVKSGGRDGFAALEFLEGPVDTVEALVGLEREAVLPLKPAPHRSGLQTQLAQIEVSDFGGGLLADLVQQRLDEVGCGVSRNERRAHLAGPVAVEQRLLCSAEKLHILGLGLAGRAGRTAEYTGGFHGRNKSAFVGVVLSNQRLVAFGCGGH